MADETMSESEKKKEDWMNAKWRPMMGWMYMAVCAFDFVLAPILWSLTQALFHGGVNVQWQPLTLQGAGLFHIAMGAVLGLAAYGRTQEKLAGANNGGLSLPATGTGYTPPAPVAPAPSFGAVPLGGNTASVVPSFGSSTPPAVTPTGVGAPIPAFGAKPVGPAAGAMPPI
jgi:hypothetical protein